MTPLELEQTYRFSGATLINYSVSDGGEMRFEAELITANQVASHLRAKEDDFIPVVVEVEQFDLLSRSLPLQGFSKDQDGEISQFGVRKIGDDQQPIADPDPSICELSFFLNDFSQPDAGSVDFIVLSFKAKSITVTIA